LIYQLDPNMGLRSFFVLGALAMGAVAADTPFPASSGTGSSGTGTAGPTGTAPATTATLPSGVKANIGRYTVTAKPEECTANAAPYQTGFWVQSNQMNIEDDGGWWGAGDPVAWTFSTNTSDVVLGMPAYPGTDGQDGVEHQPNVTKRTNGSTLTINMAQQDEGQTLFMQVWNTNGTNFTDWQNDPKHQGMAVQDVTFFLNITGSAPCAHPVGNTSCQADTIQRTPDQWQAYGVDDFLSSWLKNNTEAFKTTPMIQKFVSDFNIGSGKACTFSNQCQLIDICSNLPNGGKDPDSPRIYLALIALQNLSDLFNRIWASLNIGETDTMTQIAQIAMQFHYLNGTTTSTSPTPWTIASGSLGIASGFLGLIPGVGQAGSILGLASGILGMVNTATSAKTTTAFPDSQYAANQANVSQYLGDYVQSVRHSMEDTYNTIFNDGVNITQLLQGGQAVNRTSLQLDCGDCESKQESWMEQYLSLKTVNNLWWSQNAFITFMPYGNITQVDSYDTVQFSESDCASGFLNNPDDKVLTVCNTDDYGWGDYLGPGMARLNWYWPSDPATKEVDKNGYGKLNISYGPPGYNSSNAVFNTTGASTYKFSPTDVIQSSLRGWIQGGFGFDGVANQAAQALQPPSGGKGADNAVLDLWSMNATAAGMFSIPVCVLDDLNRWPTYWSSSDNRIGGDYYR
jgi:hypothetical protein